MRLPPIFALFLALAFLSNCALSRSEWQFHRDLLDADRLADRRDYEAAIEAYTILAQEAYRDDFIRYAQYRIAYMYELLEEPQQALDCYAALYLRPTSAYDEYGSRALYRTGIVVRDQLDDQEEALVIFAGLLRGFPNSSAADDALFELMQYAHEEGQEADLVGYFANIYPALRLTEIADNIAYSAGILLAEDLGEHEAAIETFQVITQNFHRSGLWDDAQWQTALSYQALDDTFMEYKTLDDFVSGREVSWVMADYDSEFYGQAYFRMAEIGEENNDLELAIENLKRYQRSFSFSLQVDDVQARIIEYYVRLGDRDAMREELLWLEEEYPESRHITESRRLVEAAR